MEGEYWCAGRMGFRSHVRFGGRIGFNGGGTYSGTIDSGFFRMDWKRA